MPLTILVLAKRGDPSLTALGHISGVTFVVGDSPASFAASAPHADAILVWSSDRPAFERVFAAAPRVRWVHTWAAGVEWLLSPALVESRALLTNARGVYSRSLAEFALGAMLYFAKDFPRMKRNQG